MFTRTALLVAAAAGFVAAQNGTAIATTTRVVDEYVTYCPEPTTFEFNHKKYIITEATTLTITDCPCTVVEVRKTATKFLFPPRTLCINMLEKKQTGTVVHPVAPIGSEHPKPAPPAGSEAPVNPGPGPEPQPEPKPTDVVVAGASKAQQAAGYIFAGGVAVAGLLAL